MRAVGPVFFSGECPAVDHGRSEEMKIVGSGVNGVDRFRLGTASEVDAGAVEFVGGDILKGLRLRAQDVVAGG